MFLNEATLLDNIKNRYYKDKIYVSNDELEQNIKYKSTNDDSIRVIRHTSQTFL